MSHGVVGLPKPEGVSRGAMWMLEIICSLSPSPEPTNVPYNGNSLPDTLDIFLIKDRPCTFKPNTVTDLYSDHNPGIAPIGLVPVTSMPPVAVLRTNWKTCHKVLESQLTFADPCAP